MLLDTCSRYTDLLMFEVEKVMNRPRPSKLLAGHSMPNVVSTLANWLPVSKLCIVKSIFIHCYGHVFP